MRRNKLALFLHLVWATWDRLPLIDPELERRLYRMLVSQAQDQGCQVLALNGMPDHVHLFVAFPPDGPTLARWVHTLRTIIGKKLLDLGVTKPHWQEGFFDHLLRSGESYSQKWEYVRMNPVRAGLSETPENWPYQGEIMSLRFD